MNSIIIKSFIDEAYFINLPLIMLFIYLINVVLDEFSKKQKIKFNGKSEKTNIIENIKAYFGVIGLLLLAFIVIFLLLKIKVFGFIFNTLNTLFLIYILIICPLLNLNLTYKFKDDSTMVCAFLMMEYISFVPVASFDKIGLFFTNNILFQSIVIILVTVKLLLLCYFILLSIYNINRNLNILFIFKLNTKIHNLLMAIDSKYNLDYLDVIYNTINKKNVFIRIFIFIYLFVKWIITILLIRGLFFSLYTIFGVLLKVFKEDDNNIFYILSKIGLVTSLFVTYCVIVLSKCFDDSVINIFELIVSALIIPIVLEMILSRKKN